MSAEDKTSVYGDALKELTWKLTDGKLAQGDSLTVKLSTDANRIPTWVSTQFPATVRTPTMT